MELLYALAVAVDPKSRHNKQSLTENEPRVKLYPKKVRRTNHLPVPEADANADAYELTGAVYILINYFKREIEKASC